MVLFNNGLSSLKDLNLKDKKKEYFLLLPEEKTAPAVTVAVAVKKSVEEDIAVDLRKELELITNISYEAVKEAHENQQGRLKAIAYEIIEAEKNILKLKGILKGISGESRVKQDILEKKQSIEKKVEELYRKQPALKGCISVIKLTQETKNGKHFGDLSKILKKVVDKNIGHPEKMSFEEAQKDFPAAIVIMFGGISFIVPDRDLGKELVLLWQRSIVAKKAEAAKKTAAAAEKK